MTKEGKFARFLVERLRISEDNKALYEAICYRFTEIFLDNKNPHKYIIATHNNEDKIFKISHKVDGDYLIATQSQEKTSTLKPYKLSIIGNNIRFAKLEDLIKHNII